MKAFDDLGFVVVRKDELSRLHAENEKLRAALRAPALPSEEEIEKVICCPRGCSREDDCWAEMPEIVRQARAVLALLGKTGGEK